MKTTKTILLLCLFVLSACQPNSITPRDREVRFSLRVEVPALAITRSPVSGEEGIRSLQLLCFDENRLFVGLGAVNMFPSGIYEGNITGTVPASTAVIHFVANAGLVPQDSWRNRSEVEVMGKLTATTSNTHIVYWGYHDAGNATTMSAWLTEEPSNCINLLRDRAKVTLSEPDTTWDHNPVSTITEHIVSARFAVCNGRSSGMIAPYDRSTLSFDYAAPIFLPSDETRYSGTEADLVSAAEAQFLFEDENSLENPVKVILETTYSITEGGTTQQRVKYHQVMLMRSDFSQYEIHRNHQYNLVIGNLPSSIAYDTFAEALEGSPSNNQTVFIQEIIPQITSGEYNIHILGGTYHIFQKTAESTQFAEIEFTFLKNGVADPDIGVSDFSATWLSNKYIAYPNAALEIVAGSAPGHFVLRVELYRPITNDLKSGKILLLDTRYGLSRNINIYSITAFDFAATLLPTGDPLNPYRLSFRIPDNYPAGLFPFIVRLATEDLKPTAAQNEDKALGVVVEDTGTIIGTDWDYWYTYEVDQSGTYDILLTPVAGSSGTLTAFLCAAWFGTLDANGEMTHNYVRLDVEHL